MHCEFCRTFIIPCPVSYTNLTLIWRTKSSEMCYVLTGEQIPAVWRSVLPPSSWSSSVLLHCWTLLLVGAHSSKPLVTVYQSTGFYIPEGLLWKPQISNVLIYFYILNLSLINISWREVLYTHHVWGGDDKSLAWPTSRCHRTELIVSLERGVCSRAKLQVFSCYSGWKEACQAMRAISATWRHELSSLFFSCKARHQRKFTPFWQKH